jgi:hypothetical protein
MGRQNAKYAFRAGGFEGQVNKFAYLVNQVNKWSVLLVLTGHPYLPVVELTNALTWLTKVNKHGY